MMAVETMIARQLTYFSAREKDEGRRCDLEAGMAKLLGARVAWAAADNALQIHGGNGFALEYPISRVLCDARILNIFEGAAEIQAQVIAKRLLPKQVALTRQSCHKCNFDIASDTNPVRRSPNTRCTRNSAPIS
jgi:(2S)-methylsuccinyl-CoA dehydrogenase